MLFYATSSHILSANDGSYYMSGNQLIPIIESDIKITSELLRISRIDQEWVKISVDYVFENPRNAKQVIVGFEASAPSGDANINQVISKHPYMRDFSVVMNGTKLPYKTTICVLMRKAHALN